MLAATPLFTPDGVDRSLIHWMLSLTPSKRLEVAEAYRDTVIRNRAALGLPLLEDEFDEPMRFEELVEALDVTEHIDELMSLLAIRTRMRREIFGER
jgi:hypothetical protein